MPVVIGIRRVQTVRRGAAKEEPSVDEDGIGDVERAPLIGISTAERWKHSLGDRRERRARRRIGIDVNEGAA